MYIALDKDDNIIGYKYCNTGKMMEFIKKELELKPFPLAPVREIKHQTLPGNPNEPLTLVQYANKETNDPFLEGFNGDLTKSVQRVNFPDTQLHAKPLMFPNTQLQAKPQDYDAFLEGFNNPYEDSDIVLMSNRKKPNFTENPNKRKGSERRRPTGDRERNVGHPNGEEHSRVPKGSGGRAKGHRRMESSEDIGKAVVGGAAALGAGYLIYRGVRMLPSLLPALWWTIPANIATP